MRYGRYFLMTALVMITLMGATKCQFGAPVDTEPANTNEETATMEEETMDDDAMMDEEEEMTEEDESMDAMEEEDDAMEEEETDVDTEMEAEVEGEAEAASGTYAAYDPALVANGDVVLFFHAGWCPSCRAAEADIQANIAAIPSDVTILKVDYDTATELKDQYGVTYQHTFVQVDAEGNELQQWNGAAALNDILQKI